MMLHVATGVACCNWCGMLQPMWRTPEPGLRVCHCTTFPEPMGWVDICERPFEVVNRFSARELNRVSREPSHMLVRAPCVREHDKCQTCTAARTHSGTHTQRHARTIAKVPAYRKTIPVERSQHQAGTGSLFFECACTCYQSPLDQQHVITVGSIHISPGRAEEGLLPAVALFGLIAPGREARIHKSRGVGDKAADEPSCPHARVARQPRKRLQSGLVAPLFVGQDSVECFTSFSR